MRPNFFLKFYVVLKVAPKFDPDPDWHLWYPSYLWATSLAHPRFEMVTGTCDYFHSLQSTVGLDLELVQITLGGREQSTSLRGILACNFTSTLFHTLFQAECCTCSSFFQLLQSLNTCPGWVRGTGKQTITQGAVDIAP